jgi:hypothetical protein
MSRFLSDQLDSRAGQRAFGRKKRHHRHDEAPCSGEYKISVLRAEHVPVIRNKLRDPGRLTTRKPTNSVACLADDPARPHRHCEHGDVTPDV